MRGFFYICVISFLFSVNITFADILNKYDLYNGWVLFNILKTIDYDLQNAKEIIRNIDKCLDIEDKKQLLNCVTAEKKNLESVIKNRKEFIQESLTMIKICQDRLSDEVENLILKRELIGFKTLYEILYENKLLKNIYSSVVSLEENIRNPIIKPPDVITKNIKAEKLLLKTLWKKGMISAWGYIKLLEGSKEKIEHNIDFKELIEYYLANRGKL
ncbi:hypothetical protein [Persephonella sp.]